MNQQPRNGKGDDKRNDTVNTRTISTRVGGGSIEGEEKKEPRKGKRKTIERSGIALFRATRYDHHRFFVYQGERERERERERKRITGHPIPTANPISFYFCLFVSLVKVCWFLRFSLGSHREPKPRPSPRRSAKLAKRATHTHTHNRTQ